MPPPLQPRPEDRSYLRRLGWTLAIFTVLTVVWRASNLFLLAFGSIIGAILFVSTGELLERAGIRNRKAALGLGVVLIAAGLSAIGWIGARQFGQQLAGMLDDLPGTVVRIEAALDATPIGAALVEAAQALAGPRAIGSHLGRLAITGGQFILNLMIVVVGALFIAADPALYAGGAVMLAPPAMRPAFDRAMGEVAKALRLWLS